MTRRLAMWLLLLAVAAVPAAAGPFAVVAEYPVGAGPNASVVADEGRLLAVCNSDTDDVSVIDLATGETTAVAVGRCPLAISLDPTGRLAAVACFYGQSLAVVDLVERRLVASVDLAVHPRDAAWAGSRILASGYYEGVLVAVDPAAAVVVDRLPLRIGLHRIRLHPSRPLAYVLNTSSDALYEVELEPLHLAATIDEQFEYGGAWDMVISRDGSRICVSQWNNDRVAVVGTSPLALEGFVPTGGHGPCGLDISPDGRWVAVGMSEADACAIADVENLSLRAVVPVGRFPFSDVKLTADGRFALVTADREGTVDVVDMAAYTRVDQVAVGNTPHVITPGPDGRWFVSCAFGGTVAVMAPSGRRGRSFELLHRSLGR